MDQSRGQGLSIDGRWHLVPVTCPDGEIPAHRVDLVFSTGPTGVRGAILSRVDDREVPLHSVTFDGSELRLRMGLSPIPRAAESPYLVMRVAADHLEGAWDGPGTEHVRLKLVRAQPSK